MAEVVVVVVGVMVAFYGIIFFTGPNFNAYLFMYLLMLRIIVIHSTAVQRDLS